MVRDFGNGEIFRSKIIETEAYFGFQDKANHASKGKTPRTAIMFDEGGTIYVYLIYGRYWLLNFVTGSADIPQAVLIRGVEEVSGPVRLGKRLKLDKSFYGEDLGNSNRLWIEDSEFTGEIIRSPRIGVDYAGEEWKNKPWRFVLEI